MNHQICPHFGICGGCSRQDQSYDVQLKQKEQLVRTFLEELPINENYPILASPEQIYYRNKMEFSFGDGRDRALVAFPRGQRKNAQIPEGFTAAHLGLHPKKSFGLVAPTPECQLQSEESRKICSIVSNWATEFRVPTYRRKTNSGVLRHLVIREGKNTGERLVNLVATSAVTNLEELATRLKNSSVPITTFFWTRHDGLSDVARGEDRTNYWGSGWIWERLGNIRIPVGPHTFMQTNTHAAELLLNLLRTWKFGQDIKGRSLTLLDLYCGMGALGLNFSTDYQKVLGIDIEPQSIEHANLVMKENKINNAEFMVGRIENNITEIREKVSGGDWDIIVDPPRPGLQPPVIEFLLQLNPGRVVYVSCNPESLARDLRLLSSQYTIAKVQPLDFFPHTDHVETAVLLTKS